MQVASEQSKLKATWSDNPMERKIVDNFHELYYNSVDRTWQNTFWMGVNVFKNPLDLWMYQEIFFDLKPDLIVETGTGLGGSALFIASMLDIIQKGKVVTIDIQMPYDELERKTTRTGAAKTRPQHPRLHYITGSSLDEQVWQQVNQFSNQAKVILVILDSDHSKDHVLAEMKLYHSIVSQGSYLIVEDSNINGHPVARGWSPGPMEAIDDFMRDQKDFIIDREKGKFFLSFNPRGFLKRI